MSDHASSNPVFDSGERYRNVSTSNLNAGWCEDERAVDSHSHVAPVLEKPPSVQRSRCPASLKIDAAMFDKLLAREARDVRKNVEIS
jgi:hypothetical protein